MWRNWGEFHSNFPELIKTKTPCLIFIIYLFCEIISVFEFYVVFYLFFFFLASLDVFRSLQSFLSKCSRDSSAQCIYFPCLCILFIFHCGLFLKKFIKAYLYHKIHLFQVYTSVIFSNFTKWCNHHHKSVSEHCHPPIKSLCPSVVNPCSAPAPSNH